MLTNAYTNDELHFSVSYPETWARLTPKPNAIFRIASERGSAKANLNVQVTYRQEAEKLTSKEFVAYALENVETLNDAFKKLSPDAKVVESGETFLSKRAAVFLISTATVRSSDVEKQYKFFQVAALSKGNFYYLTFTTSAVEFDKNLPVFKVIAQSFVIRPTKVLPQTPKSTLQKKKTVQAQ